MELNMKAIIPKHDSHYSKIKQQNIKDKRPQKKELAKAKPRHSSYYPMGLLWFVDILFLVSSL